MEVAVGAHLELIYSLRCPLSVTLSQCTLSVTLSQCTLSHRTTAHMIIIRLLLFSSIRTFLAVK